MDCVSDHEILGIILNGDISKYEFLGEEYIATKLYERYNHLVEVDIFYNCSFLSFHVNL